MTRLIVTEKRSILFVYRLVLDAKPDRGTARKRYFASSAKGLSRYLSFPTNTGQELFPVFVFPTNTRQELFPVFVFSD